MTRKASHDCREGFRGLAECGHAPGASRIDIANSRRVPGTAHYPAPEAKSHVLAPELLAESVTAVVGGA